MKLIDFRDPQVAAYDEDKKTYVVLGTGITCLFHWGNGNKFPWSMLEPALQAKLPGGHHQGLGDVSMAGQDVFIDGRVGPEGAAWLCDELVRRTVALSSAPVTMEHPDGRDEPLGPAGAVASQAQRAPLAA